MSGIPHEQELQHQVLPELLPDAPWKKIQQNTFTRWVNKHLTTVHTQVFDLETDLSDGLQLIRLVEVLSGRLLGKYNKKVTFRSHKLENVTLALRFLEIEEHIKIINIDSAHIVDQNLKLILGLIWHLILHYSISKSIWEDLPHLNDQEATPKQRLLAWIRSKLPSDVPVTNFTSDWNDAIAIGALVDALCPGMDLGWRDWDPDDALENTKKAMGIAAESLGVAELITPEELINPNVDEKSVMTYLSQFPMAKFRPANGRLSDVDERPVVGTRSMFKVHLAKENSSPQVKVLDPEFKGLNVNLSKTSSLVYEASYTPEVAGKHQINLSIKDDLTEQTHRLSPVYIEAHEGARLSGFSKSGVVGEETHFRVVNVTDHGPVEVAVIDAKGHEIHVPTEFDRSTNSYKVAYVPESVGLHSVNVFHNKKHIAGSPFPFRVLPQTADLKIWSRGLCAEGIRVGDIVPIHVVSQTDPYKTSVDVTIRAPDGRTLPYEEFVQGNTKTFQYSPISIGHHQVEVKSHGSHVGRSPYQVNVSHKTKSRIRAFGPGLEGGVAKHPAIFYVETHGDTDQLGFSVEGPSEAPIKCQDNGDDSAIVEYTPEVSGEYTVNVMSKGEHIKDSPFVVMIDPENPSLRPSLVRVSGLDQGLEATIFKPVRFQVDSSDAGHVIPKISVLNPDHELIPHRATLDNGVYHCEFTPTQIGKHNVGVAVSGVAVPGSPYPVHVQEPIDISKLRIYGPGVENNVKVKQPTHFFIDAKQAGSGEVEVALADREGNAVDIDVLDNKDGSFTVKYTAPKPGGYQLNVIFAGKEIPKIEINVKPSVDLSGVRVEGLENAIVTVNTEKEVHVFTPNSDSTRIVIKSPSGQIVEAIIESTPTGLRVRFTPSEIGDYTIDVTYEDYPIESSPFLLHAVPNMDPKSCCSESEYQVTASEDVLIGHQKNILVDLGKVEPSSTQSLQLISSEPDGKDYLVPLKPQGYQTSLFEGLWTAIAEGATTFKLTFDGQLIKEGKTYVKKGQDASKVRAYGDGLHKAYVGELAKFQVDSQNAGDGGISFEITGPSESKTHVHDNANGSCSFEYLPLTPGQYSISILYGDAKRHIPGSPFNALVDYRQDPSKVVVDGPGLEKKVRVGKPTHFFVDASKTAAGEVYAKIPVASHQQPFIEEIKPRVYKVTYNPSEESGSLLPIEVFYNDEHVGRSPYRVTLKPMVEPENVKITDATGKYPSEVVASLKNHFVMDISEAGYVQSLQAGISGLDGVERKCEIVPSNDSYKYHLEWVPDTAGWYDCVVSCDGTPVTSHPMRVRAVPTGNAQKCKILDIPKNPQWKVDVKQDIMVDCSQAGTGDLILREDRPGEIEISKLKSKTSDGLHIYHVKPTAVGTHNLKLLYGGVEIPNGNVTFEAVTDLPLQYPYQNGKGKRESLDSSLAESVLSKSPDMNEIPYDRRPSTSNGSVSKFDHNGSFLKQSPITYDERIFRLDLQKSVKDIRKLNAYVTRPDGIKETVVLSDNKDGTVSINYVPIQQGAHTLYVLHEGKNLQGSPIQFDVIPGIISVYGEGLTQAKVGESAHFTVNAKGSPVKQLSIAIEGLSKAKIDCTDNKDGTCSVAWVPNDPGEYRINVKLAGNHVGGSPFSALATPGDRQRAQLSLGSVSEVSLNVVDDIKKLTATIKSPSGLEESCPVRRIDSSRIGPNVASLILRDAIDNGYIVFLHASLRQTLQKGVSFTPREVGDHQITVKKKGDYLTPSPFKIKVTRDQVGDASKVIVSGAGISKAVCNKDNEILVDTRNAGYGGLSAIVEGPSKAQLTCSETQDGVIRIGYLPTEPGMYSIALKWADQNIKYAKPHQEASLYLLLPNLSSGDLKARLFDPDGHKEKIDVKALGDDYYHVWFKPKREGVYKISVTHKDQQVNGSPFQFTVGQFPDGGVQKIHAYGSGLIKGDADTTQSFNIYTREAGPGNLVVNIDGPSKANIKFKDNKDGNCHVDYTVSEPGEYIVRVKFNDEEILSSPYKVFIAPSNKLIKTPEKITKIADSTPTRVIETLTYKGDASKVTAKGSGLTKFHPGKSAMFTIDTSNAGSNLLFVGVVTNKGPCEEVIVKHHGQGQYIVNYKIHERAKAYIFVKYGDQQIPGSPFCVEP